MMLNNVTKDILKTAAGVAIGMTTVIVVNSAIDALGNMLENRKKKEKTITVEVKEPEAKETKKEEKKEESK